MRVMSEPILLDDFFRVRPPASCGASASFIGIVRDHDHGRRVRKLEYFSYLSMAEKILEGIVRETESRWGVEDVRVLHRVGELEIGDIAVAITVSSVHRDGAFQACRFIIEKIKKDVPIWKKETYVDGTSEWVMGCGHVPISA